MYTDERKKINFNDIFSKNDNVMNETYAKADSYGAYNINLSGVLTTLIQYAGKYCEFYASDLFISWQHVLDIIKEAQPGDEHIEVFGFRKSGVDHEEFIKNGSNIYRSVLAVKISCFPDKNGYNTLSVKLQNLTNDLIGLTD